MGAVLVVAGGCEPLAVQLPSSCAVSPYEPTVRASTGETLSAPLDAPVGPMMTGTLSGHVTWAGPIPTVSHLHAYRPQIRDGKLISAIVFIRRMSAGHASRWPHAPVRVVLTDHELLIEQGTYRGAVGFVPVGASIELVSTQSVLAGIQGRGAGFFTQMFPPHGTSRNRVLNRPGLVTLSSASREDWANASVHVCEHPYYAHVAADGQFRLLDVPTGDWELVCWHANWHTIGYERDPESGVIARRIYAPPVEQIQRVQVRAGTTQSVEFTWTEADFRPEQTTRP